MKNKFFFLLIGLLVMPGLTGVSRAIGTTVQYVNSYTFLNKTISL
jgi:hypothetical protein